jgi:hypothetical protein
MTEEAKNSVIILLRRMPSRRGLLFLLLVVGAFLAWSITNCSAFQPSFSQALLEGKNRWSAQQPLNYRMRVSKTSGALSPGTMHNYRLTVRNGIIVDGTCISWDGSAIRSEQCRKAAAEFTIPKLFDRAEAMYQLAQAPNKQPGTFTFHFDPTYGFPQLVVYGSTKVGVSDYGGSVIVDEFEVTP